jgi:aminoglycoside 2'-N-acetyltransferase I
MVAVAEVQTAHTADLDAATLKAVRALLDDVFGGMTGQDWEHALGGVAVPASQACFPLQPS